MIPGSFLTGSGSYPTAAQILGSVASGTGVQSIVAGAGISVNNADPQNPIVTNTGVLSFNGSTGAVVGTLASIYAYGNAHTPTTANNLAGSYFNVYFDPFGAVSVSQAAEAVIGDNDHTALTILRWTHDPFNSLVSQYFGRNSQSDRAGGLTEEFFTQKAQADGTILSQRKFANRRADLQSNVVFDAMPAVSGMLAQMNYGLISPADESLHENVGQLTGYGSMIVRPIPVGGAQTQGVFYADPIGTANPTDGYSWGFWINKICRVNGVLDTYDSGSGHADAHVEVRCSTIAGGGAYALAMSIAPLGVTIPGGLSVGAILASSLSASVVTSTVQLNGVDADFSGDVTAATFNGSPLPTGGITQLTSDVTAGPGSGSQAATIAANAVSNAKFRQSGALALVGRSANSTGDVADIQATAASGAVLRESGSTIGFGTIATAGIANNAVTLGKIATQADQTILGNNTGGAAAPVALTAAQTYDVIFPVATSGAAGGAVTDLSVTLPASSSGRWKIWGQVTILLNVGTAANGKGQLNSSSTGIENFGQTPSSTFTDTTCDIIDGRTDKDVLATFAGTITYINGVKSFIDVACTGTTSGADTQGSRNATIWNNTAAPTTFRIHCTVASKIGTGSQIWAQAL